MRLVDAIDTYFFDRQLELSPRTRETYGYHAKKFLGYMDGETDFKKITAIDIRKYLVYLLEECEVSKRYVSDNWIFLSSLWTWAEAAMQAKHVIREGRVKRPSFTKTTIEPYTKQEITAMLKAVDNIVYKRKTGTVYKASRPLAYRDRAIIMVLLDTGVRASELCELTIGDWDHTKAKLWVRHGKGDKARYVFLGTTAKKMLLRYLGERGTKLKEHLPLFANGNNKPMDRNNLRKTLVSIANQAGVKHATVHRFRHTFAVNFLRPTSLGGGGGNAKLLQALLGHEKMETLQIYVKLADIDLENSVEHSLIDAWDL